MSQMESLMDSEGHQCPARSDSIAADMTPPGPVGRRWNPDWGMIRPQERRLSAPGHLCREEDPFRDLHQILIAAGPEVAAEPGGAGGGTVKMFRKLVSSF